jgi:hypothetical protein
MSYGKVATDRQGEIIRVIGMPRPSTQPAVDDFAEAVAKRLRDTYASVSAGQWRACTMQQGHGTAAPCRRAAFAPNNQPCPASSWRVAVNIARGYRQR